MHFLVSPAFARRLDSAARAAGKRKSDVLREGAAMAVERIEAEQDRALTRSPTRGETREARTAHARVGPPVVSSPSPTIEIRMPEPELRERVVVVERESSAAEQLALVGVGVGLGVAGKALYDRVTAPAAPDEPGGVSPLALFGFVERGE